MGWGNCWTFALPLWWRDPRWSYLVIRITRAASVGVPHVMWAKDISALEVWETKPLRSVRGWPWWRVILYSLCFHYRVRHGVGEEPTRSKFPNPRFRRRYRRAEHYKRYLSARKRK